MQFKEIHNILDLIVAERFTCLECEQMCIGINISKYQITSDLLFIRQPSSCLAYFGTYCLFAWLEVFIDQGCKMRFYLGTMH